MNSGLKKEKRPGLPPRSSRTATRTETLEGALMIKHDTPLRANDQTYELEDHNFHARGRLELPWGPGPMLPVASMFKADKVNDYGQRLRTGVRLTIHDGDGEVTHLLLSSDQARSFADWIFIQADEIDAETEAEAGEDQ